MSRCATRNDILDRDLVDKTFVAIKRCPRAVASGALHDPSTNEFVSFVRGSQTGAAVQIDHGVPVSVGVQSGIRTGHGEGCMPPAILVACRRGDAVR
jgi:hypothetical protein